MVKLRYAGWLILVLFTLSKASGQIKSDTTNVPIPPIPPRDSVKVEVESYITTDSVGIPFVEELPPDLIDSTALIALDSTVNTLDSLIQKTPNSDIKTTIYYESRDSIYFDVVDQKVFLYGQSKIDYGDIQLEADRVDIDWKTDLLKANYTTDTTGKKIGVPIFTQGSESYEAQDMTYNFVSRKAVISGVVTQQGEAFMHGNKVKRNEKNEMFIRQAKYTTCNLADPHFHIASSKLKAIPGNKVVTGPFNLHFKDIPTPIGFMFGMFPEPKKKASGIIFPAYGEERRRGFFLRNGGYYFAISDYIDLEATGDIYSKGGFGLQLNSQYKKRYEYNGNVNITYNQFTSGNEEDSLKSKDFWVRWSHTPDSKGKNSRISASVNAGTSSFNSNRTNGDIRVNQTAQFSSNVSYSKSFPGTPFNMTASMRHNQNVQTEQVRLSLPELAFNMNRIFPFKGKNSSGSNVFQKISLSHNFNFKNELDNAAARRPSFPVSNRSSRDDSLVSFTPKNFGILLDRAQIGGRHSIPIATSFPVLKYLTVTPSFNYTELWYPRELRYTWEEENAAVRIDTLNRFSRAGSYSFSTGTSTRLYGMYFINGKKIQAIRHVMTPSVSFGYTPDFTDGNYQEVQISENGTTRFLSKYEGFAFGAPPRNEAASMSFSLQNNFEMKVKTKGDSAGTTKKVKLLDNLSFSTGYNFLADSFNLSNMRIATRASLFQNLLSVSATGSIDPYVYVLDSITETATGDRIFQRRINEFAWNRGQGLGQLNSGTLSADINLRPASFAKKKTRENQPTQDRSLTLNETPIGEPEELEFIRSNPDLYVDWNVPWTFRFGYNMNYRKRGFEKSEITQTMRFSGDVSITQKMKISFSSGYDLKQKEITSTRITASRDLHCWVLNFNWVPAGRYQSFLVEIKVRSSILQDLKMDKKSQFF
ncbi:MAG: putative LPS assembly protein LptD [Cyclobacteriaceae bacterium]